MNSVHEPSSRTMSKNRLRNTTESIRVENRPSAPSAQPKASLRAQATSAPRAQRLPAERPALAPRLCPACRAPRAPAAACFARPRALYEPRPRAQLPAAPARAPTHARLHTPRASCVPSAQRPLFASVTIQ